MRFSILVLAVLPVALAAPAAQAHYVKVDFSGHILAINPGTAAAFGVNTPITFEARYDTSKLVDHTQSVNDGTGLGFSSVLTASLSDDPKASLSIKIGSTSFTKFDAQSYGNPEGDCGPGCDLGGGNYPIVEILNGAFAGFGNIFINAAGYSLDADPIADAFGGFDLGSGNGGFDFFLGKSIGGDPFAKTLAVGNFDASSAVTAAVPEPSTWALMIGGFGLAGGALRRRTYVVQ
ncbi:PEPxxWA-CTERM sorting domain-containing protein [Polymorphobacter sp. PAMC 29334]|uniref:PEPxxWA-CTERM sorting domain-containing protein n=1 Tax=Polymorphobacter sp. PAMC 29334 TaxID=2862331 RepID=UPI001D00D55B|nr:PEPxxWA-CTERM sorting domain-containing protein [Polymorphobacter sp. PAMC 29334]